MRVLICGDRNYSNYDKILNFVNSLPKDSVVIEGGARGADTIAAEAAKELGLKVLEFKADWGKYGRAAGPIRNRQMLDEGKPDVVAGFHDNIESSKGTKDMLNVSKKRGIKTLLNPDSINTTLTEILEKLND